MNRPLVVACTRQSAFKVPLKHAWTGNIMPKTSCGDVSMFCTSWWLCCCAILRMQPSVLPRAACTGNRGILRCIRAHIGNASQKKQLKYDSGQDHTGVLASVVEYRHQDCRSSPDSSCGCAVQYDRASRPSRKANFIFILLSVFYGVGDLQARRMLVQEGQRSVNTVVSGRGGLGTTWLVMQHMLVRICISVFVTQIIHKLFPSSHRQRFSGNRRAFSLDFCALQVS
jgi:hypothetical protein